MFGYMKSYRSSIINPRTSALNRGAADQAGAQADRADVDGRTPLHLAAGRGTASGST